MQRTGSRFGAKQKSRPDLRSCRAQRHRGSNAVCVRDTAGGNDRHVHRAHDLRHQRKCAQLGGEIFRQENAAVPACFETLRNDCIDSVRFEPKRFLDSGCGRKYLRTPGFDTRHQRGRRQAEMKAHHRGLEFAERICRFGSERLPPRPRGNRRRIDAEFLIVGRQCGAPVCFALRTRHGWRVAKEIHVERFICLRFDQRQFLAHGIDAQHGAGQGAESAGVGHSHRECARLHTSHWRLHDRQFDAEQLSQVHRVTSICLAPV